MPKFSCTTNSRKTCTACPSQWKTHRETQTRTRLGSRKNSLLMKIKSYDSLLTWESQGMLYVATLCVTLMTSLTRKRLLLGLCGQLHPVRGTKCCLWPNKPSLANTWRKIIPSIGRLTTSQRLRRLKTWLSVRSRTRKCWAQQGPWASSSCTTA